MWHLKLSLKTTEEELKHKDTNINPADDWPETINGLPWKRFHITSNCYDGGLLYKGLLREVDDPVKKEERRHIRNMLLVLALTGLPSY